MPQPKNRFVNICQNAGELLPASMFLQASLRGSALRRKEDRLVHCEGREVDVVLWTILNIPSMMLSYVGRGEGIIVDFSFYIVETVSVVR